MSGSRGLGFSSKRRPATDQEIDARTAYEEQNGPHGQQPASDDWQDSTDGMGPYRRPGNEEKRKKFQDDAWRALQDGVTPPQGRNDSEPYWNWSKGGTARWRQEWLQRGRQYGLSDQEIESALDDLEYEVAD